MCKHAMETPDAYLDEGLIRMGLEGDSRLPCDTRSGDRLRAAPPPPDFPFALLSYDLTKSRIRYANS